MYKNDVTDLWRTKDGLKDFVILLADEDKVSQATGGLSINYIKGMRKQALNLLHKVETLESEAKICKEIDERALKNGNAE